jgi:hypothetical protein
MSRYLFAVWDGGGAVAPNSAPPVASSPAATKCA